ncbi:DUF2059 domain-containing protein [Mesorhizobium koreense]|jgi:hypothetical protein|uniref:DUF2059 domain-containing protein n=1 Tax=Mesorhizobium koreense TaxID=3074855 RepID=UPI00287BA64A|nr:DUF2059 domain-containing protein [Mesorhizobium sp. WR6]
MISTGKFRNMLAAAGAAVLLAVSAVPSHADDISETHLQAARDALSAIHATDAFDRILPAAAQALKGQLIQKDPNFQEDIISIVDKQTLALAQRRADLETESATDYAKAFTEDELKAIATFYNSPAGKTLLEKGPQVTAEIGRAAVIWQRGIARDLAEAVAKEMAAKHPIKEAAPAPAAANGGTDQPKQDDSNKQ